MHCDSLAKRIIYNSIDKQIIKDYNIDMNTRLYTQKEVAEILGVSLITINKWVRTGKVKVVYLPTSSRPRITQEELDRLRTPVDKKPY